MKKQESAGTDISGTFRNDGCPPFPVLLWFVFQPGNISAVIARGVLGQPHQQQCDGHAAENQA
jgi:hypothetical protein